MQSLIETVVSPTSRCCVPIVRITPAPPRRAENLDPLGFLDVTYKPVFVLEDVRALRFDLRDHTLDSRHDKNRSGFLKRALYRSTERAIIGHARRVLDSAAAGHHRKIGARGGGGRRTAYRFIAAVIKHNHAEVFRRLAANHRERPERQQKASVGIERDNPAMREGKREPQ